MPKKTVPFVIIVNNRRIALTDCDPPCILAIKLIGRDFLLQKDTSGNILSHLSAANLSFDFKIYFVKYHFLIDVVLQSIGFVYKSQFIIRLHQCLLTLKNGHLFPMH